MSVFKVGEHFPDVSHRSDLLPVESVVGVTRSRGDTFTQVAPRTWVGGYHQGLIDPFYLQQSLYLQNLAGQEGVEVPPESATEFRWRLRDTALAAGERSSVSIRPIAAMCAEFGADKPLFRVGGIVSSKHDLSDLPVGTVVYAGHPDVPAYLNVWEVGRDKALVHLMGPLAHRPEGRAMTIHSMPGETQVPEEPPATEEELARIALRAYRIGQTYQKRQNWCGVFANCLDGLGINDKMLSIIGVNTKGPGDELTRDEIGLMPQGTILWHRWRHGQAFAVYLRDDGARGRARTRRLFGWNDPGANNHDLMTVVSTPTEPMAWTIAGYIALHMPDGTVLRGVEEFTLDAESRRRVESWRTYAVESVPL